MLKSKINNNKSNMCVSKTDTNPPFAFQIAFPRGTDFTGFLQGGSKSRDLQSEMRDARPWLFIFAVLSAVLRSGFRDTVLYMVITMVIHHR